MINLFKWFALADVRHYVTTRVQKYNLTNKQTGNRITVQKNTVRIYEKMLGSQ